MELYIINTKEAHISERYSELLSLLSEDERERVLRRKGEEDRRMVLTGLYLRRCVLDRRFGAGQYRLTENEYGKPLLLSPKEPFFFNTSNSGDFVLFGYGETPVGVDVEKPRERLSIEGLLRFFSEEEAARVRFSGDPEASFYEIWTMREAFSKLVGVGLSLFSREEVRIDYEHRSVRYREKTYAFYTDLCSRHRIAVCGAPSELPPQIFTKIPENDS